MRKMYYTPVRTNNNNNNNNPLDSYLYFATQTFRIEPNEIMLIILGESQIATLQFCDNQLSHSLNDQQKMCVLIHNSSLSTRICVGPHTKLSELLEISSVNSHFCLVSFDDLIASSMCENSRSYSTPELIDLVTDDDDD